MAAPSTCYVIFGAAVRADGSPSGSLRRRVDGAFALGGADADAIYIVSGGVGRYPPAEAEVMAALLGEHGVRPEQVVLDRESTDTLSSVRACARLLRAHAARGAVVVCTSAYHQPRCRVLFRLAGIRTSGAAMPADLPHLGFLKFVYYLVRETVALPYDVMLMILSR